MRTFDKIAHIVLIFSSLLISACNGQKTKDDPEFSIISQVVNESSGPFYIPIEDYPKERKSLPIGIFDSGTGGLAVLNTIYQLDKYNNSSNNRGGDGMLDFDSERFIYLADEANMPYGRYDSEGKADFLREFPGEEIAVTQQAGNGLITEYNDRGELMHVQLNSVNNYIRYMVTHMLRNALNEFPEKKLSRVILGCTHYPYFVEQIREHFLYLKRMNPVYNALIDENIMFIDPSESLASELYLYLTEEDLWGRDENEIDEKGEFPYEYKYSRNENSSLQYVKIVPFSNQWISESIRDRMKLNTPYTYQMIYGE
ncbi:MAG: hypothetical protein KAR19_02010 [Bacteroidales bacterium]|nr:hypothetical protein [Bacteroidales bacterium]